MYDDKYREDEEEEEEEGKEERRLYRDRFMKKKEERSHALRTTVAMLLAIALLALAFLIFLYGGAKSLACGFTLNAAFSR